MTHVDKIIIVRLTRGTRGDDGTHWPKGSWQARFEGLRGYGDNSFEAHGALLEAAARKD